ncbi:hypothetical protein LZD49_33700 [Dyadobacter sp. CY261]|uniref:hypothetical protein n=1 Tax=Dyadobacter sp. CY261 TaxID=2907203 RepID=UPI001F298655|nr:hypothetical protein [Dyadobacter sp. CY261]MCF0075482.1 hypothetical protein [Dyadobacter sp. CY261]
MKGKSLPEITTILFNEGRSLEAFSFSAKDPASQKKADFEFVTGQLQYAFGKKEVVNLSTHYGLDRSYRALLEDLVERGEMPENSLSQLR